MCSKLAFSESPGLARKPGSTFALGRRRTAATQLNDTKLYVRHTVSRTCSRKRSSLQHSRIMIHQPLGGAQGQASDIRIQADEILFLKDRLNKELSDRTGQPLDRIQQDTDRDFFMSPTEAVNYGLIDSVIDKRPVQAVA